MDVRPWQAVPAVPATPAPPSALPQHAQPQPPQAPYGSLIPRQPGGPGQHPPPPQFPPSPRLPPPPVFPPPPQFPPPGVTGYWQVPPQPVAAPRRRTRMLGWVAAVVSTVIVAVPSLLGSVHRAPSTSAGLHSVAGISQQPWSAEFVDESGLPARWDPCVPISYVVNYAHAPAGASADVTQAFARLSTATGMSFVAQGLTAEQPMRGRSAYQPTVYGSSWAPILISWSAQGQTDLLDDPKSEAVTVPIAVASKAGVGGGSIVSAEVVLNTARQLPVGFGPGASEGEVLMHELGHAVGLGHVASRTEAMYPSVRGIAAYGPGDLAGFAAVGLASGCHAAPGPHPLDSSPTSLG